MARPSEEIRLAWASLSGNDPEPGWRAIALAPAGCIEVHVGRRSPDNAEAVLFEFPSVGLPLTERLPDGQGFSVERADPEGAGRLRLALSRRAAGSAELFSSMVSDVLGALDVAADSGAPEPKLLRVLLGRIVAWQNFMSKGAGPLGSEAELGLAGELYFLKLFIQQEMPLAEAISGWVGPEDAPQDFLIGTGAIEVKATMSSSGFPVRISSLEQLDDAIVSPIYLAAVRFSLGEGGANLPDMIACIEQGLEQDFVSAQLFRERLLSAGYYEVHAGHYTRRFEPKESRIYLVADGFPRLTSGSVPVGISRAHYEINLDHVDGFLSEFGEAMRRLGVTG